jgi:hypothetical protein
VTAATSRPQAPCYAQREAMARYVAGLTKFIHEPGKSGTRAEGTWRADSITVSFNLFSAINYIVDVAKRTCYACLGL